jgi:hypothetical protein
MDDELPEDAPDEADAEIRVEALELEGLPDDVPDDDLPPPDELPEDGSEADLALGPRGGTQLSTFQPGPPN